MHGKKDKQPGDGDIELSATRPRESEFDDIYEIRDDVLQTSNPMHCQRGEFRASEPADVRGNTVKYPHRKRADIL